MKRSQEPRLKSIDIHSLSGAGILQYTFRRKSFFRDYKLLHYSDVDEVKRKVNVVLEYGDVAELIREILICYDAAVQLPRQTYEFNRYVSDLLELYYSNLSFSICKREIVESRDLRHYDSQTISYDWVMNAKQLTVYQRYLLFEYLVLGYTLEGLARRRYCTTRTISNHIRQVVRCLEGEEEQIPPLDH